MLGGQGRAKALRKAQLAMKGQIPRPVLLGRVPLPGKSRTGPGHFHFSPFT